MLVYPIHKELLGESSTAACCRVVNCMEFSDVYASKKMLALSDIKFADEKI